MTEDQSNQTSHHIHSSAPNVTFAGKISTSTLANLLVHKGILTTSEILQAEQQVRLKKTTVDKKSKEHREHKKKHSRLKKWASKKRWSRRLSARLFGWEWKKSKMSNESRSEQ